jgi:hypothetical protein
VRLRGAVAGAGLVEAAHLPQPVADGVVRVLDARATQTGDQTQPAERVVGEPVVLVIGAALLRALAYALASEVVLEAGDLPDRAVVLLDELAGTVVMEAFWIRGSIVDGVVSALARIRSGRWIPWAAQRTEKFLRFLQGA